MTFTFKCAQITDTRFWEHLYLFSKNVYIAFNINLSRTSSLEDKISCFIQPLKRWIWHHWASSSSRWRARNSSGAIQMEHPQNCWPLPPPLSTFHATYQYCWCANSVQCLKRLSVNDVMYLKGRGIVQNMKIALIGCVNGTGWSPSVWAYFMDPPPRWRKGGNSSPLSKLEVGLDNIGPKFNCVGERGSRMLEELHTKFWISDCEAMCWHQNIEQK